MPRAVHALALLLMVAGGCAAGPPRWVKATADAPGHCLPERTCRYQDDSCRVQRRRETALCQLDRARQDVPDRGAVPVFDELALLALSPVGQCDGSLPLFSGPLLALYPDVHAQVEAAFAAGQIDLTSQRARLLLHVLPATDAASAWRNRLHDLLSRAQAVHQEHLRLAETLPGAALFHHQQLDHREPSGLLALQLQDGVSQRATSRHNHEVTLQVAAGCEEALERVKPGVHRWPGVVEPAAPVHVQVNRCTEVQRRERLEVLCATVPATEVPAPPAPPGLSVPSLRREPQARRATPAPTEVAGGPRLSPPLRPSPPARIVDEEPRTVSAWRVTSGYEIHASWRRDAAAQEHPVDISFHEQQLELPVGCELGSVVPLESFSRDMGETARSLAYKRFAEQLWMQVHDATPVQVNELRDAAQQATGRGDLDRADHFYQLVLTALRAPRSPYRPALAEPEADAALDEAEAWFARRYGTRTRRDRRIASRFVVTPIGLVFEAHADLPFADPRETDCWR